MIYLPEIEEGNCVVIIDSDTIRVYEERPTLNGSINYKDYYPKLNYLYTEGVQVYEEATLPTCQEASTNIMNRPDINYQVGIVAIIMLLGITLIYNYLKDLYDNNR